MATDKNKALGMNVSTASAQLKKLLMFRMMQELEKDYCFQCHKPIETADDLSVEHRVPWLSAPDPKASFFDLSNVAFSHLSCNSAAASRPNKIYTNSSERRTAEWNRLDKTEYAEKRKVYPSRKKNYKR